MLTETKCLKECHKLAFFAVCLAGFRAQCQSCYKPVWRLPPCGRHCALWTHYITALHAVGLFIVNIWGDQPPRDDAHLTKWGQQTARTGWIHRHKACMHCTWCLLTYCVICKKMHKGICERQKQNALRAIAVQSCLIITYSERNMYLTISYVRMQKQWVRSSGNSCVDALAKHTTDPRSSWFPK